MNRKHIRWAATLLLLLALLAGCAGRGTGTPETEALCKYRVSVLSAQDLTPLQGAVVNFCTEESCQPVVTGENGEAVFTAPPARYHVQIVKLPEGWQLSNEADGDFFTEPREQSFQVLLKPLEP